MMVTIVLLAGMLVDGGAAELAATPPAVVVEAHDEAFGLGRAAAVPAAPAPSAASAPASVNVERMPSGNPLWAIPLRQLSATRERPLFASSRRPPAPVVAYQLASVPPPAPPKQAEPEKPGLSLIGTIAGGAEGIGVFFDLDTRSVLRLKMGDGRDGWVLRGIRRREATLEKGRQSVVLTLPLPEMNKAGPALPNRAPPSNRTAEESGKVALRPHGPANVSDEASLPIGAGSLSPPAGPLPAMFTPPMPVVPEFKPAPVMANPFRDPLQIRR